jgi:hypothetical protein
MEMWVDLIALQVILATNRIESLDPALLRPGRVDRKIEFPLPDPKTKRRIFGIHTGRMTLSDDVNLEEFVMSKDELSGADIKAVRVRIPPSPSSSPHWEHETHAKRRHWAKRDSFFRPFALKRKSRSRETALSKTDVMILPSSAP